MKYAFGYILQFSMLVNPVMMMSSDMLHMTISQATWLHACMVPSWHIMSIYQAILGCQHHDMSYQFCQSIDCCTCLVFMAWNVTLSSHSWLHIQRVFFLWHGHMFFHHSIIFCDTLFPILII